jgi:TPP-dependent pyruvate/acetoin dehydrogenase alpha subunit
MPGEIVDGNDVAAVYLASQRAIAKARAGEGPTFLEFKTMRMHGHSNMTRPSMSRANCWRNGKPKIPS